MKKEIDAIRAKDIAQGGLTQGQQTQIARNEQRISQVCDKVFTGQRILIFFAPSLQHRSSHIQSTLHLFVLVGS